MKPRVDRPALVDDIRRRLLVRGYPRVQILLILVAAGCAAFIYSALALSAGVTSMALRYSQAAAVGYLTFLLMIRLWIAWYRKSRLHDGLPDVDLHGGGGGKAEPAFGGGRSGGGGASGQWPGDEAASAGDALSVADSVSDLDLEDAWYAIVALALLAGGALVLIYVIYVAPLLLAEVALDAALVATAYRKLRREDQRYWAGSVIRRTWLPAAALVAFAALAGYIIQQAWPGVTSIGGIIRALAP
jgi:hypothetical protein